VLDGAAVTRDRAPFVETHFWPSGYWWAGLQAYCVVDASRLNGPASAPVAAVASEKRRERCMLDFVEV